ncbi:M20/M25/M40 family metallo-hydrolase [Ruthenibacterium lactatiformans]|uniref:M20/M25/M40 family metallo-hydrolase n=1 Tax=Ruthenibacterium lactatiformans TaxID=1550024 RepID=UPI003080A9C7
MSNQFSRLVAESGQSVSYMIRGITHICRRLPPRSPGSAGERETAAYLAEVLRSDGGCREVRTETFREHPDAFYGYFYFSMTLDVLCAVSFFLHPWLSILFGSAALLLFLFQFVLYWQIIDPLFPERESVNVTAVRPCAGEVKRRIFLNGHIDAAWEFPLNYHFGGVVFEIPGVMAVIGVAAYIALSVCALRGAGTWVSKAALGCLLFIPFFIAVGFTYNPKRVVDGANDNLSGCYMGIALLQEMERLGIRPEHTEVGVILTGSEEAGLRGAKAWCEANRDDYRDVPTYILCFDTIHDPRFLMVNERDLNGTVRSDPALSAAFLQAAADAGVPCKKGWVPPFGGATDSAAFTQGGFRSVGITGLNHRLEDYYHTRRDTCDNLDAAGLENCYKAAVHLLELAEQGLLESPDTEQGRN